MAAPGDHTAWPIAVHSDVRTDVPQYRVYRHGTLVEHVTDITSLWRGDLVCFYIGCSFTFEKSLIAAGVPVRNVQQQRSDCIIVCHMSSRLAAMCPCSRPAYRARQPRPSTPAWSCPCAPCRHIAFRHASTDRPTSCVIASQTAIDVTAPLQLAHGAPVHHGDPHAIGIANTSLPEFGQSVQFEADDVPVFWACGVTAMMAAISAATDLCITHAPGCMFIADVLADELLRPQPDLAAFPKAMQGEG